MSLKALLLVEDEDDAAALATAHLPDAEILRVRTVAEAEEQTEGVDAVILDLGLPDSEGFDTLAHLLQMAPHVPVIVLTGSDDPALRLVALEAGAQEFVNKGDIQELRERVDAAIIRQRHRNHALSHALTAGVRAANLGGDELDSANRASRAGLGASLIREALPEVFATMTAAYLTILHEAVDARTYVGKPRPVSKARRLVRDLARLNAAPRDLVDLHLAAMDALGTRTHPERLSAIAEEGRIVLLETLGYLALHYRDHAPFRIMDKD